MLWRFWLRLCPYRWRARLVPGWSDLTSFVDAWMACPVEERAALAYSKLGVTDGRLSLVLRRIGSLTWAFQLVVRGRELTPEERLRFSTHVVPPEKVDWPHICSGTAGLLGALYMLPPSVGE